MYTQKLHIAVSSLTLTHIKCNTPAELSAVDQIMYVTVNTRAEHRIASNIFCLQYILIVDDSRGVDDHTIVAKTIVVFCVSNNVAMEDFPCTLLSSST